MRCTGLFLGVLLVLVGASFVVASDEVLFSNPPVPSGKDAVDVPWMRLGGGSRAYLESGEKEMIWDTSVQNVILSYFTAGKPVPVNPGEALIFSFKFRASGLNAADRAFQVGFFSSDQALVDGDSPATVVDSKFKGYSGYIAAVNLAGGSGQAICLYRRNPNTEAVDNNNLFGLSTTNVTYLGGGPGYAVQEDEDVEGILRLENGSSGIDVSFSLNGIVVGKVDSMPLEAPFDTLAFISYGGNTQSITFTRCEVKIER